MNDRFRVALIVETSLLYGRRILGGINRYVQAHSSWSVFLTEREATSPPPRWLEKWRGDGIICRTTNARLAKALAKTQVPIIDLNDHGDHGLPRIYSDHRAIGRLAAQHLLERGFHNFGFCGYQGKEMRKTGGENWAAGRRDGFVETLRAAGMTCAVRESAWELRYARPYEMEQAKLLAWLQSLPKPAGVMTCNDYRGQQVLDACLLGRIAVLGVDNDELICNFCNPPLSSVNPNAALIGYEAARLLNERMCGKPLPEMPLLIEPLGLVTRQSTDVVAIEDADIAAAVRFVRERACSGLSIAEILRHVAVSRSYLDRGFQKFLGRTPREEIRHVQVRRAKELLGETDLPLAKIAALTGFEHPEYLNFVFKRDTGQTPGEYRRQIKLDQ
jgi:LacI family transcriptional regulator